MKPTQFILFFIIFSIGNGLATTISKLITHKKIDVDAPHSHFRQLDTVDIPTNFGLTTKPYHEKTPSALDKQLAKLSKDSKAAKNIKELKELNEFGILDCIQCEHRVISDEWGDNQKNSGDQIQCRQCDKPVTIETQLICRKKAKDLFEHVNLDLNKLYSLFSILSSPHVEINVSVTEKKNKENGRPY